MHIQPGGRVQLDKVSNRTEFAAALSAQRENSGLSVRELAKRLGVPHSTLGEWFSGRHLPGPAQLELFGRLLAECGVIDVEAWTDVLQRVRSSSDRRITRAAPPYRGLQAFEPDDAALFFGRERETAEVLRRVEAARSDPAQATGTLVVIGPSGSGKSSLLRAGVTAGLRAQALSVALTTPSQDALARLAERPDVLVVDQFEEAFTQLDPAGRGALLKALESRDAATVVVLGLRADFYAAATREPSLIPALQHGQIVLGALSRDELREAIVRPAAEVGMSVDEGLVELILADLAPHGTTGLAHDPGALPLLSHCLLATWERARGPRLTVADYRAAGGIEAAVQHTAEQVFAGLTDDQRQLARRVFVRLANLEDDVRVTRRRVGRAEVAALGAGAGEVADRFVEARLLTADQDSLQVSHEALLTAWPRLRHWLDDDRDGLRLHRQVTEAARIWQEAGRDPALLLRGARLDAADDLAAGRADLTPLEREFVDAGRMRALAEAWAERRRVRRLRSLLAVAAALAAVSLVATGFTVHADTLANRSKRQADAARDRALSRQVAIETRTLAGTEPGLAEQLALAGYRISPTVEARSALLDRSAAPLVTRVLGAPGPTALAVSPDGTLVAVGHADDGSVHLYRFRAGQVPRPLGMVPGAKGSQVFALAFLDGGAELAVGGTAGAVAVWDLHDPGMPSEVATLSPQFSGAVESIAVSPDGNTLVAASTGRWPVQEWDLRDPRQIRSLHPPAAGPAATTTEQSVAFGPHGSLAAGGTDGDVYIWPADTSRRPRVLKVGTNTVDTVVFDRSGADLFAGDRSGAITEWAAATGRQLRTLRGGSDGWVDALALSPDGSRLAAASSDDTVTQWDTATWQALDAMPHPGPVTGVAYTPDGRTLLSTAADGTLRSWSAQTEVDGDAGSSVWSIEYMSDGRLVFADNGATSSVRFWSAGARRAPVGPPMSMPAGVAPSDGTSAVRADGSLVAAGNGKGQVALWDTSDPAHPFPVAAPFAAAAALVESLAFSPDGRLLAVGSDDHAVHLWDVSDPAHPRAVGSAQTGDLVLGVAFGPHGHLLAAGSADDHAYLWDVRDPAAPRRLGRLGGFASYVYGVAFSPDGRTLAATSADDTTRLWDLGAAGTPQRLGGPLRGPTNYNISVAFSPDGTRLAVASEDHTVWLYDVGDRRHPALFATLRALDGSVSAVAFSPDGRTLAAGGRSPSLMLWRVSPGGFARALCTAAGSPVTRAEWKQYVPGAPYAPPCDG